MFLKDQQNPSKEKWANPVLQDQIKAGFGVLPGSQRFHLGSQFPRRRNFLPGRTQNPTCIWTSGTGFAHSWQDLQNYAWRGWKKQIFLGMKRFQMGCPQLLSMFTGMNGTMQWFRAWGLYLSVRFKDGGSHDPVDGTVDVNRMICVCAGNTNALSAA